MNWKLLLKLLITLVAVGLIAQKTDLPKLAQTILNLPLWTVVLVAVLYAFTQVLSAVKWQVLASSGGLVFSHTESIKAYFIGMFVNCFGLGMVGGDVVRGVIVSTGRASPTVGITSVVADRAHGLAVLAGIGGVSAAIFQPEFLDATLILILVGTGLGVSLAWIVAPMIAIKVFSADSRFGQKVIELSKMLTRKRATLVEMTVVAALSHLIQIWLHWYMARAVGAEIPFFYILATVPFINILGSLPISWNGVGVREVGYLFFFSQQHPFITTEQGVVMGALWLIAMTSSSAIGGAVSILSKDLRFRGRRQPPHDAPCEVRPL